MTDKLRAAAQNALDTLEHILRCVGFGQATIHWNSSTWEQSDKATDELREALAEQPEVQEPVAYAWYYDSCGHAVTNQLAITETPEPTTFLKNVFARGPIPLYTNQAPACQPLTDRQVGAVIEVVSKEIGT